MSYGLGQSSSRGQTQRIWRNGALTLCALIVPTVGFSVFIALARHFAIGSASADYTALAVSVVFGMMLVWRLPYRPSVRALLCSALANAWWVALPVFALFLLSQSICDIRRKRKTGFPTHLRHESICGLAFPACSSDHVAINVE